MISKKDLSDAEMDTLTKSCSPTIVFAKFDRKRRNGKSDVSVKQRGG